MSSTMIQLQRVCLSAGSFKLSNVQLSVAAGEYVALMGRTGEGKTSLLECLAGLRDPASGSVLLAGRDITQLPPADRGIGYVPQDLALFPHLTVQQNLAFSLKVRGIPEQGQVHQLAEWLGISHLLTRRVTTLSGGEAQRTALGRALTSQPAVLLLDEPFSALDEVTRSQMYELMRSIRSKTELTVLHVTHSRAEALELADRIVSVSELSAVA
jgi:ABC-type sugar transport system ATPase subunit